MDLSFLIPSKVRRAVLSYWVENPEAEVGVRELARNLHLPPQLTHRELVNLEGWGMLFSSRRGHSRAFRLNHRFPLYPPIRHLLTRYQEEQRRGTQVQRTYKLEEMVKQLKKISVPPQLIPGLTAKRSKPRAYVEEKILERVSKK